MDQEILIIEDNLDDDEETILTSEESTFVLESLEDELLLENIYEQIDTLAINIDTPVNFISAFENRVNFLTNSYKEVPDVLVKIKEAKYNFYNSVLKEIVNKYELSIQTTDEKLFIITRCLYEFFILEYKDNLKTFILEYIRENKKSLSAILDDSNKNIDFVYLKKIFKNKNDASILFNLYKILNMILNQEISDDRIVEVITQADPSELNNYFIYNLFVKENVIVGSENFDRIFFDILIQKTEGYTKIINDIQMELYSIFPKK